MNTKIALIVLAASIITGALTTIIGGPTLFGNVQQAEAAIYQPTDNIKTFSSDPNYSVSNPLFYVRSSGFTYPGWIKVSTNVTNNSDQAITGVLNFYVNGITIDSPDSIIITIPAHSSKLVTSQQHDINLALMDVVVEFATQDKLIAEKSLLARLTEKWEIVSVPPKVWYDVKPDKIAYKLGNEVNKTNDQAGLIEIFTEYFDGNFNLAGRQFNYIDIPLSKVGDPFGTAYIGIFTTSDANGNKPIMAHLFGKIKAADLSTTMKYYRFYAPDFHTLEVGDHIGVLFEHNNNAGNYIQVYGSNSDVVDTTKERVRYSVGNQKDWMVSNNSMDAAMVLGWEAYLTDKCIGSVTVIDEVMDYFCNGSNGTVGQISGQQV